MSTVLLEVNKENSKSRPESADSEEIILRHHRRKGEFSVSRQNVARHRSADDCWIIIADRVYNITHFLKDHPGGQAILLAYAGRDATREFETHHQHSVQAIELMEKLYVADVDTSSPEPPQGGCTIS
jgi:cytochrome b involved in lipid metabolism